MPRFFIREKLLHDFTLMGDPQKVHEEVRNISDLILDDKSSFQVVHDVFSDILKLFRGEWSGYQKCNTEYHDLRHTTDTYLAMARLIHGSIVEGEDFSDNEIIIGLIAALMHDTGYIQTTDDTEGTGAKYTRTHVDRSVEFLKKYFNDKGLDKSDAIIAGSIIHCTGLNVNIENTEFRNEKAKLLGQFLGAADLLGQMADRFYLEKLLFLFYEFQEGKVPGFESEFDLLKKTIEFNEFIKNRLKTDLNSADRYMKSHFKARWKIEKDFYRVAINTTMKYLKKISEDHPHDYRDQLRRGGLVKKLEKKLRNKKK